MLLAATTTYGGRNTVVHICVEPIAFRGSNNVFCLIENPISKLNTNV